jgi:hypothetical protein
MKSTQASDSWFQGVAARDIHMEQLKKAERFNGRAAMVGIVIGIITEGLTGAGIVHQIGWMAMPPAAPNSCPSASDSEGGPPPR